MIEVRGSSPRVGFVARPFEHSAFAKRGAWLSHILPESSFRVPRVCILHGRDPEAEHDGVERGHRPEAWVGLVEDLARERRDGTEDASRYAGQQVGG
jgi:hypothetical protein